MSQGPRTSCGQIIPAQIIASSGASSSSCRVQGAHVSGFVVAKVGYCCRLAPAPQINGEPRFFVCASVVPRDLSTGTPLGREFHGFDGEFMGKPNPNHPRGGALYAGTLANNESEDPQAWLEPKLRVVAPSSCRWYQIMPGLRRKTQSARPSGRNHGVTWLPRGSGAVQSTWQLVTPTPLG